MADLTTLAAVKEFMGITNTSDDALINSLNTRVSAFVESFCNRTFLSATHIEFHDGRPDQAEQVLLDNFPVISITTVHDDLNHIYGADSLIPAASIIVHDDTGVLRRADGIFFTEGFKNIRIEYVAGFTATPPDLEQAVIEIIAVKVRNRGKGAEKSEKLGRWSVTYRDAGGGELNMTAETASTLNRYKNRKFLVV